jgi:excisionase family DNA binding protein
VQELLTTSEAARRAACASDTIQQGVRLGRLIPAAITAGGARLFRPADIDAWNRRRPKRQRAIDPALKVT